jgi:hypothetical protein
LVKKIKRRVAAWFYGYWITVWKYRQKMVKKLMESFGCNAALLVHFSVFDPITLIAHTAFEDVDEQVYCRGQPWDRPGMGG